MLQWFKKAGQSGWAHTHCQHYFSWLCLRIVCILPQSMYTMDFQAVQVGRDSTGKGIIIALPGHCVWVLIVDV